MFKNRRYITSGIDTTVPLETQILLWGLIDRLCCDFEEVDYLQVFELSKGFNANGFLAQKIVHKQEEPEYLKTYLVTPIENVTCKIYVIDDVTHSTMLLAEEY